MGPLQHPVIILQDTDYNDLNAIISFMYRGQCLVSEKQLPSVLAAAKLLQIRGLCDLKVQLDKSLGEHRYSVIVITVISVVILVNESCNKHSIGIYGYLYNK